MATYSNAAIFDLRKYLIAEIMDSGVLSGTVYPASFGSKVPIVPLQQLPETNDNIGGKPFIVYDFSVMPPEGEQFWAKHETATFTVYSDNFMTVVTIFNLLVDILGRQDLTVRDINVVAGASQNQFLTVQIAGAEAPQPAKSDGGRTANSISIDYSYTRPLLDNGRFAS